MILLNLIKAKRIWIVCILAFFSSHFLNELNLKHLSENQKRENQTVKTSDDPSYLNPPKNYIKYGEWKENGKTLQSCFVRSPGYGLFYYTLIKIVGESNALFFLKIIQLILFSLSVYCLYFITNQLINNDLYATIVATIYGCTPIAIGFLYYSLTEGITPSLLLFYIFFLFKAQNNDKTSLKNIFYFIASLVFAYLFVTRPVLGIFGLLIPFFIIKDYSNDPLKKILTRLILYGLIAISFTSIWQYRNYRITNKFVGFHSIYYPDNNSIYRPTFKAFWTFVGGWAQEGHIAHSYMVPMWSAAINGDTSHVYIDNAINTFPKSVITYFGTKRLFSVFKNYQKSILYQKPYFEKGLPMPTVIDAKEQIVVNEFKELTKEYKRNFWGQYYIISPIKVFKLMAFHSNLSLYIFQKSYRGNLIMESVRLMSFLIHAGAFLALLASFFFFKKGEVYKIALLCIVLIYILFMCYYQRGIEERYTLPLLPLLLIALIDLFYKAIEKIKLLR